MRPDVEALLAAATAECDRLRALGWTRQDFAHALSLGWSDRREVLARLTFNSRSFASERGIPKRDARWIIRFLVREKYARPVSRGRLTEYVFTKSGLSACCSFGVVAGRPARTFCPVCGKRRTAK